jgi:rRNA-processing protein FCF1
MTPTDGYVTAEMIRELERVSADQLQAARSGRFEEVRLLLGIRQRLLDGLCGRVVRREDLDRVATSDRETHIALREEIRRMEQRLSHLGSGGRALLGYATPTATPPAYLDQVR